MILIVQSTNVKLIINKNIFEENKKDIKKSWIILKRIIGKHNDKTNFPNEFHINNTRITDHKKIIANSVNEYFSRIGLETSHNVPNTDKHFTSYMSVPVSQSMFIEPVSELTVIETSKKLKSGSSSGHDEISTNLPKETIDIVIKPITHIVNK